MKLIYLFFVTSIGLAVTNSCQACSCGQDTEGGFIHAATKVLPANAKGVLFLNPSAGPRIISWDEPNAAIISRAIDRRLQSSDFEILVGISRTKVSAEIQVLHPFGLDSDSTSDYYVFVSDKAERSYVAKARNSTSIKKLLQMGLLKKSTKAQSHYINRISPQGGFQVGTSYFIRYLRPTDHWSSPREIEVKIDEQKVELNDKNYTIKLAGPVELKAISQISLSGSCSSVQVSQVQKFSFPLSSELNQYVDTMVFLPATDLAHPLISYEIPAIDFHRQSLCSHKAFGKTSTADENELLVARCGIPKQSISVNAQVGFLEIEDTLRKTNIVHVDFDEVSAASCSSYGILKSALEKNDTEKVKETLCMLTGEESRLTNRNLPIANLPDINKIWAIRDSLNEMQKKCLGGTLSRFIRESNEFPNDALTHFKDTLLAQLSSNMPSEIESAVNSVISLEIDYSWSSENSSKIESRVDFLMQSIKGELLFNIQSGTAMQSMGSARILSQLKKPEQAPITTLLEVGEKDMLRAPAAMLALSVLAPDNPDFHRLLLKNAEDPKLLEMSSLYFATAAGKLHPDTAVKLLLRTAAAGNTEAIRKLSEFKSHASQSIPFLIQTLGDINEENREAAFATLIDIYDGQKEIITALRQCLVGPKEKAIPSYLVYKLTELGAAIDRFRPEIEALLSLSMDEFTKRSIKGVIQKFNISKLEKQKLLHRLDRVKLQQPNL